VEDLCEDLDLFEDWDFWIRVSRHFRFLHIDKVTAEYRFYGAADAEESHRKKYRYDKARATVFDRSHLFLDGEAWVNFLNNGSAGKFREDALLARVRLAGLKDRLKCYEKSVLEKEEELRTLKSLYDAQLMRNGSLKRGHVGFQMKPESIQRNSAYKVWKKIVRLIRG